MDFLEKLGQNIKRIRQEKKLTQAQLAELADISVSTIARLEIGQGFLTFKTIEKIAHALKVETETLFDVSQIDEKTSTQKNFIKEISKYSSKLRSEKDFNFILDVLKSYIKNR